MGDTYSGFSICKAGCSGFFGRVDNHPTIPDMETMRFKSRRELAEFIDRFQDDLERAIDSVPMESPDYSYVEDSLECEDHDYVDDVDRDEYLKGVARDYIIENYPRECRMRLTRY
jgi:hypothetical protein